MLGPHFDFVNVVVADRDLVITSAHDHACRLEPRGSDLAWFCDLDDGTPPSNESDPAAFVRWVCPDLRQRHPAGTAVPVVDVRRTGPQSDLGKLMKGFGRLAARMANRAPEADTEGRFVYTDPAGILDTGLRQRIENWPSAMHGDGVVRPAELVDPGDWRRPRRGVGVVVGECAGS